MIARILADTGRLTVIALCPRCHGHMDELGHLPNVQAVPSGTYNVPLYVPEMHLIAGYANR